MRVAATLLRPSLPKLLLLLALAGCSIIDPGPSYRAVSGRAGALAPDQARLVIYRPGATHLLGVVASREILINGAPACALRNDDFLIRDVAAGPVAITDGASALEVKLEPGSETFVRVAFNRRRASVVGWVPPVLGFEDEEHTPESGLFAIQTVDPALAARDLAKAQVAAGCGL